MSTVSVYILSYNQIDYLAQAIESVLTQTRLPDQILIIDDASTDGSLDLIRSFESKFPDLIDVIVNEQNLGIGSTRRIAVNACTGDMVSYLDGDDLYLPRKIELEEQALVKNPNAGFAYSNFRFINEQGTETGVWAVDNDLPEGDVFSCFSGFMFPQGVSSRCELVRKHALLEADQYEAGLNLYQVLDTMLRVSRFNSCVAVNEMTHEYRRHDQGVHRLPYAVHYDTLQYIYVKNKALFADMDNPRRDQLQRKIDKVLAQYAWRAVKQMSKTHHAKNPKEVLRYAKAAHNHQRRPLVSPKHALRTMRAMAKSHPQGSS